MCNRAATQKTHRELMEEFKATHEWAKAFELADVKLPKRVISPHGSITALHHEGDTLRVTDTDWGFPFKGFSWNARDDKLDSSPAWSPLVGTSHGHCIVLVTHPMEPFGEHALEAIGEQACIEHVGADAVQVAKKGGTVWHALPRVDGHTHMIPGLITERDGKLHTTMITTNGGTVFSRLHRPKNNPTEAREIVSLRTVKEAQEFLDPETNSDWRDLLRPADEDFVSWYRVHPDAMKRDSKHDVFTPYTPAQTGLGAFT